MAAIREACSLQLFSSIPLYSTCAALAAAALSREQPAGRAATAQGAM